MVHLVWRSWRHHISKMRRTPKPSKPPFKPMSAHQSATPIVSPDHLLQIGQVIVVWSKLENAMQDTIWHFLHLEMTDGKIVTERMGPETFLRILRAIGSRNLNEPVLHEFLSTMDKIEDDLRIEILSLMPHGGLFYQIMCLLERHCVRRLRLEKLWLKRFPTNACSPLFERY